MRRTESRRTRIRRWSRTAAAWAGFAAATATAADFVQTNAFEVPSGTVREGETWAYAVTASVQGVVSQDLFLAGLSVELAGECQDDVWAYGEHVNLTGSVGDDARLAGRAVVVDGRVGGTLMAAGSTVHVTRDARVGGSLVAAGESLIIEGEIGGPARLVAAEATLGGRFGGPVRVTAGDLVMMPGTVIDGDLEYTAPRELVLDTRSVTVRGAVRRIEWAGSAAGVSPLDALLLQAGLLVAAMLAGVPLVGFFPAAVGRSVRLARHAPFRCAFAGLLFLCLTPLAALALAVTLIGLPLGAMLLCAYGLVIYLGKVPAAIMLGSVLLRRHGAQSMPRILATMAVGLAVLYASFLLPAIGLAAWLAVAMLGGGSLLLGAAAGAKAAAGPGADENAVDRAPPAADDAAS